MKGRAEYDTERKDGDSETVHNQVRIQVEVRNALTNHV